MYIKEPNGDHMSVAGFFVNENVNCYTPEGSYSHAKLVPKVDGRLIADVNLFLSTVDWSTICNDRISLDDMHSIYLSVLDVLNRV